MPNEIYFKFHGGGCYFEFENGAIDVDFGPNDRTDGFDFYRIKEFLLMKKLSTYKKLMSESILKLKFEELIEKRVIRNPQWSPGSELFYLSRLID